MVKIAPLRTAGEIETAGVNPLTTVMASVTFLAALARVKAARTGRAGGPTLAVDLFNDHQLVLLTAGAPVKLIFPPHVCWGVGNRRRVDAAHGLHLVISVPLFGRVSTLCIH